MLERTTCSMARACADQRRLERRQAQHGQPTARAARGTRRRARGMTLMEVLIALFIFMVGIVGVLAALPTGVNAATWVIFQDAAIHL